MRPRLRTCIEKLEPRHLLSGDPIVATAGGVESISLAPTDQFGEYEATAGPRETAQTASATYSVEYRGSGIDTIVLADDFLPVETNRFYGFRAWARSGDEFGQGFDPANRQSIGFASYDSNFQLIRPEHVLKHAGAVDTRLAAALSPGDTVVHLLDAKGWSNEESGVAASRGLAWYGGAAEPYRHTRDVALGGAEGLWLPGAVVGDTITLNAPWSGPALPEGAAVRNVGAGDLYTPAVLDRQPVSGDWTATELTAVVGGGELRGGTDSTEAFRPGTAYLKPMVIANQHGTPGNSVNLLVEVSEVDARTNAADLFVQSIDLVDGVRTRVHAAEPLQGPLVRIDPEETYRLSGSQHNYRAANSDAFGFASYDQDRLRIHPLHVTRYGDAADTALAAPLLPGDVSFLVDDATGWSNDLWESAQTRSLAWYGYIDSTGRVYDDYTYTRNGAYDFDGGLWSAGAIAWDADAGAYRVDLAAPWQGPALAAGDAVRNAASGVIDTAVAIPGGTIGFWVSYQTTFGGGLWADGIRDDAKFRPGTAYIRPYSLAGVEAVLQPVGTDPGSTELLADSQQRLTFSIDVLDPSAPIAATRLPGDYNNDLRVDAADYTVWRDTLGETGAVSTDGNGDGRVSDLDRGVWGTNYGAERLPSPLAGDFNSDGLVDAADYTVWRDTDNSPAAYDAWSGGYGSAAELALAAAAAVHGEAVIVTQSDGEPAIEYRSKPWFVGSDRIDYALLNLATGEVLERSFEVKIRGDNLPNDPDLQQAIDAQAAETDENQGPRSTYFYYDTSRNRPIHADGSRALSLTGTFQSDDDTHAVRLTSGPSHGTLDFRADGTFDYVPHAGYAGIDSFRFVMTDGRASISPSVVISVVETDEALLEQRLRQVMFASLNYEEYNDHFPIDGNPYLSWRVQILPYLGYRELYDRFRHDEPWDSPHNLPLASEMPHVFADVEGGLASGETRLRILSGEGNLYYLRPSGDLFIGPRPARVTDGLQNTLLFLQAGADRATVWTRPEHLPFDEQDPLSALGTLDGPLRAVFMDGAIRTLPETLTNEELTSLATVSGAELLDAATLERRHAEETGGVATFESRDDALRRLRTLSFAMHNHHDTRDYFPVDTVGSAEPYTETRLLSWRVQLLPYLGHQELYDRFNFDEPWDGPTNLPLLAEMPDLFRSAGDPSDSTTTRLVRPAGPDTANRYLSPTSNRGEQFRRIVDGLPQTVMLFEAGPDLAVPWTMPGGDPGFDPADPRALLGTLTGGDFPVAFFDASTGHLPADLYPAELAAIVTRSGEELVDASRLVARYGQRINGPGPEAATQYDRTRALQEANWYYQDAFGRPPEDLVWGPDDTPHLSSRVALLRFLYFDSLYDQFRRDEPWDSPHNLALVDQMPDAFRAVGAPWDTGLLPSGVPWTAPESVAAASLAEQTALRTLSATPRDESFAQLASDHLLFDRS